MFNISFDILIYLKVIKNTFSLMKLNTKIQEKTLWRKPKSDIVSQIIWIHKIQIWIHLHWNFVTYTPHPDRQILTWWKHGSSTCRGVPARTARLSIWAERNSKQSKANIFWRYWRELNKLNIYSTLRKSKKSYRYFWRYGKKLKNGSCYIEGN